ncbi:MAG: AIR carboxylase family protein [Opitutae bacterium]|nr:AIR carboxylase family protein [Opitutae bacterium]
MKKAYILMGSESDMPHAEKIARGLEAEGIAFEYFVRSAHKDPVGVFNFVKAHDAEKSVVWITIAGRSNALSGVVAANAKRPVLACPPFKDKTDFMVNINSTLQMPSKTPVLTILDPANCALAAARILGVNE